ncbi:MAG: polysaccharide deacetylase family protein [Bacteroidetes bacterium]|nr:polysaccharide deacetylase family protein [Bacteroidota bacterium]
MNHTLIILCCCLSLQILQAQNQTSLAERLGYPANAKLLVIHADDLAVAHSENEASTQALERGIVTSASVMVPCPWFPEIARYAKTHPGHDLGLHLTLTSEWLPYRWGPVCSRSEVPGLVDSMGYFYPDCASMSAHATPAEVKRELKAQIERARAMGLEPTHFDSHMRCLFYQSPAFFEVYLQLGREYHVPVMVGGEFLTHASDAYRKLITPQDIVVDRTITATPRDYEGGMAAFYTSVFKNLQPGVNVLVMHTAFENDEMTGITAGFPGKWDAAWRQDDYNFFTSEACKKLLQEQGIQLIGWKTVGKLLRP